MLFSLCEPSPSLLYATPPAVLPGAEAEYAPQDTGWHSAVELHSMVFVPETHSQVEIRLDPDDGFDVR